MRRLREIFGHWRLLRGQRPQSEQQRPVAPPEPRLADNLLPRSKGADALVLGGLRRRDRLEWQPVDDSRVVDALFQDLRNFLYDLNRRSKRELGVPPRYMWEAGQLAGQRPYVFLKPWNERGVLLEGGPKGWVVSRADKIASHSQFVRDRLALDRVTVYQAKDQPGMVRIASEAMGESMVSLVLYEDFIARHLLPK